MTQPPPPYQPAPPAWSSPAAPAPRKHVGLVALVIGLAAVLVGIIGFGAGRLTAPTHATPVATSASPSSAASASATVTSNPTDTSAPKKGFTLDGTTLTGVSSTGSTFTTTLPEGWMIGSYNGGGNSGQILNATADTIDYFAGYDRTAQDNCHTLMQKLTTGQPIVTLAGPTWAGKATTALDITLHSDERNATVVLTYVCVDTTAGHSDLLRLIASPQTNDAVMRAATSLLSAWTWS